MDWVMPGTIVAVALLGLLAAGTPIAFAMGIIGVVGLLLVGGSSSIAGMPIWMLGTLNSFTLIAVPLYIFFAEIVNFSGITRDLFNALRHMLARVPGTLGIASIFGAGIFAAISGSSVATAVVMGKLAVPEMLRAGYDRRLTIGVVAAGGTLGILIPPSIPMIILGTVANISVGRLFMGGVIPGLILVLLLSLVVLIRCVLKPELAPSVGERKSIRETVALSGRGWPFLALIIGVLGSIYLGIATPTEAAAVGCVTALVLAWAFGRLNWEVLKAALLSTVLSSAFVLLLVAGVTVFTRMASMLGIPQGISAMVIGAGLPQWGVIAVMCGIYFLLGMFIDSISIILITVPIFLPIILALGFDPIWFGVMVVINLEIGLLTPPVGLNAFVIHGIVKEYGISLATVFAGIMPFVPVFLVAMVLFTVFPELVLWLPNMMFGK